MLYMILQIRGQAFDPHLQRCLLWNWKELIWKLQKSLKSENWPQFVLLWKSDVTSSSFQSLQNEKVGCMIYGGKKDIFEREDQKFIFTMFG